MIEIIIGLAVLTLLFWFGFHAFRISGRHMLATLMDNSKKAYCKKDHTADYQSLLCGLSVGTT